MPTGPAPEPAPNEPSKAALQKDPQLPTDAPPLGAAVEPVTVTPDPEGIVRITATDKMRFNATRIEVKASEPLKVELHNIGTMPKEAMGHNFVVLKSGAQPTAFAQSAMGAKATDYVPPNAPELLGATRLLGPGEKQTIEVALPGPGTYPFLCSFPGHVGLMTGVIVAQ